MALSGLALVTGGAGFIGSHLAAALAENGARVRIIDDLSTGHRENIEQIGVDEWRSHVDRGIAANPVTESAGLSSAQP